MNTVIIDVRTSKEFQSGTLPGAINIPSNNFTLKDYEAYKNDHISLLCSSGNRAELVRQVLHENGITQVSTLHKHLDHLAVNETTDAKWSVDRQFRLALGILLAIFFVGIIAGSTSFFIIPAIVCAGLFYSVLTNNCYLKIGIALLPWNRKPKASPLSQQASNTLLKVPAHS